ncbi:MAG: metallophosphoesterase [Oscillospiraceae bacterium]
MEKAKSSKKPHRRLLIFAILAAILLLLFVDSGRRLVSSEYERFYENLPQSFDGYRIVQISDLHTAQFGRDNSRLLALVSKQKPDVIVLTGDLIEKRENRFSGGQSEKLSTFLEKLSEIAPCFFVSGNHEWASGEISELTELLQEKNIRYLHNEAILLQKGEDSLVLLGVEDPNGPADMMRPGELVDIINSAYPDNFKILLGHRNDWLVRYPKLAVDIIMCGHAHGGVVRLPGLGGVFGTELDFFPKYDGGLFNEGSYDMIISRGLGGRVPMPRLFNNPELVTLILRQGS